MPDLSIISTADLVAELSSRTISDYSPVNSEIVAFTAEAFNVSVIDILSRKRTNTIGTARIVAMALCREITNCSLNQIGSFFNRHHGTVIHAVKRLNKIEYQMNYAPLVKSIRIQLENSLKVSKTSVHTPHISLNILKPDINGFRAIAPR